MQEFQFLEPSVYLHRDGVFRLSGQERHLFYREILDIAHADYFLVFLRKLVYEEKEFFSIQSVRNMVGIPRARFEAFLDGFVERHGLVLAVFVDEEVIEDVIQKRFHHVDLAFFDQIAPGLHERRLHEVFAGLMIVYFEESIGIQFFLVVEMRDGQYRLPFHFLFWSHHKMSRARRCLITGILQLLGNIADISIFHSIKIREA